MADQWLMQIEKIETRAYRLKFKRQFSNANSSWGDRAGYVIKITTNSGLVGLGEAAPLPGWSGETLTQTAIALDQMAAAARIVALPDLQEILQSHVQVPAACHGIELAYLDLLAQSQQLPLYQWLNPQAQPNVCINGLLVSDQAAIAQAQTLVDQGYTTLKLKIGRHWEQDLALIQALRTQLGFEIKLRLDLNQAWSLAQAIARLPELVPWQIEYLEQPLAARDLVGMAKLHQLNQVAIAADESVQTLEQLQALIKYQAADFVILKPMVLGGILASYRAAQIATQAGITPIITTTLDGAIARTGAIHLAAALGGSAHGLATGQWLAEDLFSPVDLLSETNPIRLGDQAGLGLSWQNMRIRVL
ncbi:MAG: o-succinylbenzoate synthase [Pseudanabaenaceae cyanobacterium bins.68]|nr:o-succinylbenzoate synthase [Pseudanabaenaceae cyanobacterium bins.68]